MDLLAGVGRDDLPHQPEKVGGGVCRRQGRDDSAGADVQRRVQVGGAAPAVVVGALLDFAEVDRQQRLGSVQRLDPGLGVDGDDDLAVGRVQVESNAT